MSMIQEGPNGVKYFYLSGGKNYPLAFCFCCRCWLLFHLSGLWQMQHNGLISFLGIFGLSFLENTFLIGRKFFW